MDAHLVRSSNRHESQTLLGFGDGYSVILATALDRRSIKTAYSRRQISEKIHTLIKAEDVSIDSYWLGLFAKLFKGLVFNVGSGGGAAPVFEEKKPVQYLASKYIKASLDKPVKGEKKKLKTKLQLDKFYKKSKSSL
ncbi:hypothetical protein QJS10_CPB17g00551 [Acorus calamus]|uniref:Uncharacterized protein n=1 Tax=Acorus calamus TaxID=4465 RepID=A0AAV9CWM9_ACOCL|nr:hypothetical protein QJS10_CPB17g00551 [Acorus calamus]